MSNYDNGQTPDELPPDPSSADDHGDAWEGPDEPTTAPATFSNRSPIRLAPEAFYGIFGDIVNTLEEHSEADPAGLLVQALVMFGNIIGRGPHWIIENNQHYGVEFAVLVGPSGAGRKGTSYGRIRAIMAPADPEWAAECQGSGLSTSEGLLWALRDESLRQGRGSPNGGQNRMETDPGVSDKRKMIVESEWALVLKHSSRQGNTLSAVVRQCWDSQDRIQTMTKSDPIRVTGAHVSVIGHITPEELCKYLTETEVANGFGNRHLFVSVVRSKSLPFGSEPTRDQIESLQREVASAVSYSRDVTVVGMTPDAKSLWRTCYEKLHAERPGIAGALLSRGDAHVRRLAMLYALGDECCQVGRRHLEAALAVWQFCEASVRELFGTKTGDPLADELMEKLKEAGTGGMNRTAIHSAFNNNRPVERITAALETLRRNGLAHSPGRQPGGHPGRSEERWFAGLNSPVTK